MTLEDLEIIPATETEPERVRYSGHTYRAVRCPYCNSICYPAETVDVGFGSGSYGVQCDPHHCPECGAVEMSPHSEDWNSGKLSDQEKKFGWYEPPEDGPKI